MAHNFRPGGQVALFPFSPCSADKAATCGWTSPAEKGRNTGWG